MQNSRHSMLVCALLACTTGHAQSVSQSRIGGDVERQLPADQPFGKWVRDLNQIETDDGDRLEKQMVARDGFETVKLKNVIPAVRFDSGVARIPEKHVAMLRDALDKLRDRHNVRLHLVGHADDQRLSGTLARTFGDNAGLSRERAGEVAEYLQKALLLAPDAVSYEWAGDTKPIASNATAAGRALNRRVEIEVWYDEPKVRVAEEEVLVQATVKQVKVCRVQTLCKMRFKDGQTRRARLKNLVPALHYVDETTEVPAEFIERVRQALDNLHDKQNLVVKLIGYTDDAPLSERNQRIYGDALALSKARAHRAALVVQEALKLPDGAIASEGRGATLPLGPNDTEQGRAMNRRIEVQFWHDDPLQELPEEPQMCPDENSDEVVTKVYQPPWGPIAPLQLENGRAIVPPGYTDSLRRAMADISGRNHVRLRFVGYTANRTLDRRTASVYGDDVGLSAARAQRAMETIREQMQIAPEQAEHEGRGYVQSPDVVNNGFTQGEDSYVAVQVVYDELAVLDDYEGVDITRLARELTPKSQYGINLMHISVDGKPLDDPDRSSADVQRCTDVALQKANIQFQFDNLKSRPRLGVTAAPKVVTVQQAGSEPPLADPVYFKMYANYAAFIRGAEVRIFDADASALGTPLAVLPVDPNGIAEWRPDVRDVPATGLELKYVLRAKGDGGRFDDTNAQPLWILREERQASANPSPAPEGPAADPTPEAAGVELLAAAEGPFGKLFATVPEDAAPPAESAPPPDAQLLGSYGENDLALQNIRLSSGTVTVRGDGIPQGHIVWVAGHQVPVDPRGNFIAEEIFPTGTHTVEVAVLDPEGNGNLYLRDLEFPESDRFFVGMADFTVSKSRTSGDAQLLQGENAPYDFDSSLDGRLAFYGTQKFGDHWRVTASADTREGPVKNLFSNFLDKSPDELFRRIDPDNHYPTFADDGIVEEVAPTLGKFYVKVNKGRNHALWGNFKTNYSDNELAQVDRGLYGANAHWQSEAITSFGEQRASVDAFAAQPGTVAGRDEFRGTGGSLYFLRNQDILTGSERVRIELRDKDSGLVTGVVNLQPSIDYELDYLQGRVLLAEPLSSTGSDNLLVRSGGLSGEEAYLVVRYEYSPGFDEIKTLTRGGEGHVWLNDYVKIGLTGSSSDEGDGNGLSGADITLRKSADSWLKVQSARSEGLVSSALTSVDGGYGFAGSDPLAFGDAEARGLRADLSVGFGDFFDHGRGRLALYSQSLGSGYSAPGFSTLTDLKHYGGTLRVPVGERLNVIAKADRKVQEMGLQTSAAELDVRYQLNPRWSVGTGVRKDEREDFSPVVPLTQQVGERTDAVVSLGYDSRTDWRAYGFVQDTVSRTDSREDNGRFGVGGSYRFGEKLRLDAEVSDGDLGAGGRVGTNYLLSDRTSLYINYALENESAGDGLHGRRGNLISGVKRRFSDSSSVYLEERYQETDMMSGLTHATGVTLTARDRWNFGANTEIGTLVDSLTGAKTEREAGGIRVGYAFDRMQISSGVEYRADDAQQADATYVERNTWLFRNNFRFQLSPDWRVIGKFNYSTSTSSQGQFYDGGYTEAVIGYGFRPIASDRLDVLAKYTYFYNLPTTGQTTLQSLAAQYVQKSNIASLDVTYDLTSRWTIGGKYAYRVGQMSLSREQPEFFDNTAMLYIARVDYRLGENWEGMVEARMLDLPDFSDRRAGALLGVYRHVGKHVKVGVGYNFTDFSEDLTNLSFRHQGVFMNVVGSM
jgi:flagellar motor protein MotB